MIVTVHSKHITPSQVMWTPPKQTAWEWVLENWHSAHWIACPEWVKSQLRLHPQMGVCSGNLVTRVGDMGMTSFCKRVNQHKEN